MIPCEILLLLALTAVVILSCISDCRNGQVPNRLLLPFATAGLVMNTLYYALWAKTWLGIFGLNLLFLSGCAILLYAYHIWAAGDSKLVIVIALLLPGRYLSFWDIGAAPGFLLLAAAFILSFLYVIAE